MKSLTPAGPPYISDCAFQILPQHRHPPTLPCVPVTPKHFLRVLEGSDPRGGHCHIPCPTRDRPPPSNPTGPRRTPTRSAGPLSFYSNLLLHLLLTYSFLTRHPRTPLRTPPASGHPPHSAPSFRLSFRLTYLIRVYPLASASLYRTPTPVLTHRTPTGPPIRTRSFSI